MGTSETCSSHVLPQADKSRIRVFKISAVSHVRTLPENIHSLFELTQS